MALLVIAGAFFDEYRLSQITLMLIEKYKKTRKAAGKSNVTVNRELTLLRHMFNKCIAFKMAQSNPFRMSMKLQDGTHHEEKVRLFKESGRDRYLSEEEAQRLVQECNEDLKLVVRLAMGTGFRSKEIKTLVWSNIDLTEGTATVTSAYSKNGDTDTVPLSDDLIAAFRALKDERNPKEHDRVFTRDGKPWNCWKEAFNGAVERAGIKDFHFHDLRHCYGSWLAKQGVAFENRVKLMRHRDPKMTMRYTHLDAESRRAAVNMLPSFNLSESESHQIPHQEETAKVVGFRK